MVAGLEVVGLGLLGGSLGEGQRWEGGRFGFSSCFFVLRFLVDSPCGSALVFL